MNYHFIGIGGVSMKALAQYTKAQGHFVSGSDKSNANILYLKSKGIDAYAGEDTTKLKGVDVVVYSSAISKENKELKWAINNKIKILKRSEYLKEITKKFKYSIFVAGCHGKSTTSAIICKSLMDSGYGLFGHVGADFVNLNSNMIYTGEDVCVVEACEYDKNFLNFNPKILVVVNIDYDHPDTYQNEKEICLAYQKLLLNSEIAVINEKIKEQINLDKIKYVSFGRDLDNDYIYEITSKDSKKTRVKICKENALIDDVYFNTTLEYNIENFIAAYVALDILKNKTILKKIKICNQIKLKRRCEKVGSINGADVIFDYAHHPSEINAVYKALSEKYNKILTIFEPHTYSRTIALFSEFVSTFCKINNLCFLETFKAREESSFDPIYDVCKTLNRDDIILFRSYMECSEYAIKNSKNFDLILFLGAGDIYSIKNLLNMDKTVSNEQ